MSNANDKDAEIEKTVNETLQECRSYYHDSFSVLAGLITKEEFIKRHPVIKGSGAGGG